jgi:Leucine-rich repeat (LRR) protein
VDIYIYMYIYMSRGKSSNRKSIIDTPRTRKRRSKSRDLSKPKDFILSNGLNVALKPLAQHWEFDPDNLDDKDLKKIALVLKQPDSNNERIKASLTIKISEAEANIKKWNQRIKLLMPKNAGWVAVAKNVRSVKKLFLANQNIHDLKNLIPYLDSLEELNVSGNRISDLSALKDKLDNMKVLRLSNNHITDISPLTHANITELHLGMNQITDITPIASMKNLKVLDLKYNPINDLDPILKVISHLNELNISGLKTGSINAKNKIQSAWGSKGVLSR